MIYDSDRVYYLRVDGTLKSRVNTSKIRIKLLSCIAAVLLDSFAELSRHLHCGARCGSRKEDDLAVGGFGHCLHRLEISDLHRRSAGQDVGGLAHKLSGFDFGASSNNLRLSDTLGLSGHGERVLELVAEDDILDQHALDLNTPAGCDIFDNLSDRLRNLLTALNNILEDTGTNNVTECGLCTLNKSLADIGDSEGCLVWGCNVVVDDRGQVEGDVVLSHTDLLGHLNNLNLNIDLDKALAERVDLDQTRINSAVEATELGDQTDITLRDRLVWVGADDAARNGTHGSDTRTQSVDHASVPAMVALVALADESLGIAGLEILSARRLDVDHGVVAATGGASMVWAKSAVKTRRARLVAVVAGGRVVHTC